jgi:hypothetical protein
MSNCEDPVASASPFAWLITQEKLIKILISEQPMKQGLYQES